MKLRAAEIIFRHKLVILLPLLIILPITTMIGLRARPLQWQSFTVIWVDQYKPLYAEDRLTYTPAASQSQLLNDLVHTRTFALEVLGQTRIAPPANDPDAETKALRRLWKAVRVWASSTTFVTVEVSTENPDLSYEISNGIVTSFQKALRTRTDTQGKLAVSLYDDALAKAEQAVTKSRNELAAYIAAHPDLANRRDDTAVSATQRDATLARLTAQVKIDEGNYEATRRRRDDLQESATAGIEGQTFAFTVVDEPQRPTEPIYPRRMGMIAPPLVGLIVGLLLGSATALFLVLTNRAVLGTQDIQGALGVPVLGEIPELRGRRWPWQRSPRHAVRLRLAAPAQMAPARAAGP